MADRPAFSLLVGFGSETGGAEQLASLFVTAAHAAGLGAEVEAVELNAISPADLAAATHFVAITATYGEGEFPFNADLFWELLAADSAPRLEHLAFAVLALGDKYYIDFANAGKLLDARLAELGATRLTARVECDVDFDADAAAWTTQVIELLSEVPVDQAPVQRQEPPQCNRTTPFTAEVSARRLLTKPGSDTEVWHYEIDLADSGLAYQAGDAVGIHPINDPALVEALLSKLDRAPADTVAGYELPLGTLLAQHLEIRTPSRALQALVAARTTDVDAAAALGSNDHTALEAWLYGRDLLDLLELADLTAEEVLETLRPLQYRDYSIASSPLAHPDQLHLTVATVRHHRDERARAGVASGYLADRAQQVRLHLQPNNSFRLPPPDVPIIMIGPGTGIAPFRAFLQERRATGCTGRSWLFFGHRRRATDYLYEDELQDHLTSGVLTRLNLAFSRDSAASQGSAASQYSAASQNSGEPEYVQHHMLAHADELFTWLEEGAHVYVCGDEKRMAKDVHAALEEIVAIAGTRDDGTRDDGAAHAYVNDLIKHHRYVRDVY